MLPRLTNKKKSEKFAWPGESFAHANRLMDSPLDSFYTIAERPATTSYALFLELQILVLRSSLERCEKGIQELSHD